MQTTLYIVLAFAMGLIMSIYLPMNSSVTKYVGSSIAANVIFFIVALLTSTLIFLLSGRWDTINHLKDVPAFLYLAGFVSAFVVLAVGVCLAQGAIAAANLVLARDQLAHELGLAADLQLESSGRLKIRFDPEVTVIPGERIQLRLVHATRPGLDQDLVFDNHQLHSLEAELQLPGPGRWNLYLQTEDWRLTGSLQYPQKQQARLLPNYVVPDVTQAIAPNI